MGFRFPVCGFGCKKKRIKSQDFNYPGPMEQAASSLRNNQDAGVPDILIVCAIGPKAYYSASQKLNGLAEK
jgi:hypothetical protein